MSQHYISLLIKKYAYSA